MTRLTVCIDCGRVVSPGPRCYACRRRRSEVYNANRPAHHAFYRTAEWRRLSAEVRRSATRCWWCLRPTLRLLADHVMPLEKRPDLALDRENVVPSCYGCNNRRARNSRLPDLPIHEPAARASVERSSDSVRTTSALGPATGRGHRSGPAYG